MENVAAGNHKYNRQKEKIRANNHKRKVVDFMLEQLILFAHYCDCHRNYQAYSEYYQHEIRDAIENFSVPFGIFEEFLAMFIQRVCVVGHFPDADQIINPIQQLIEKPIMINIKLYLKIDINKSIQLPPRP